VHGGGGADRYRAGAPAGLAEAIEGGLNELKKVDDPLIATAVPLTWGRGQPGVELLAHRIEEDRSWPAGPVILLAEDADPSDTAGLDPLSSWASAPQLAASHLAQRESSRERLVSQPWSAPGRAAQPAEGAKPSWMATGQPCTWRPAPHAGSRP